MMAGVMLALDKPAGSLAVPRCVTKLPTSTFEKMAPKIAVPNDPPMDRKKVAPEGATPSSGEGTACWPISTSACTTQPSPTPSTNMYSAATVKLVPTPNRDKSKSPIVRSAVPAIGKTRQRPVLLMRIPDPVEQMMRPTRSGNSWRPEVVGDSPCTIWKNTGRYVIAPNIAKPMMKPTRLVTENPRLENRCSGSTGSIARRSTTTKMTSSTAPVTPKAMIVGEPQG